MEYKKYTICPTFDAARINLEIILIHMKEKGYLQNADVWAVPRKIGWKVNEDLVTTKYYYETPYVRTPRGRKYINEVLVHTTQYEQTDEDPGLINPPEYRIYDYLSDAAKEKFKDHTIPPHSVDYIIDVNPRFHAIRGFEVGLINTTTWYLWDYDHPDINQRAQEEILKVNIEWTLLEDTPYKATNSVFQRKTTRAWAVKGGDPLAPTYIPGTERVTYKEYDTVLERREEGRRRRSNIITLAGQDYTILSMLLMGRDEQTALEMTEAFFAEISHKVTQYKEGSTKLIFELTDPNSDLLADLLGDSAVVLDMVIPDVPETRLYTPNGIGMTVKEYITERVKGNV